MTAIDRERTQGLLAEGWRLLERGEARQAALVFGRVALVAPTRAAALRGLASARAAITESERRLDERLDHARRALENGDRRGARDALEAVIAEGGDRDGAAALLHRLDPREGRLERPPAEPPEVPAPAAPPIPVRRSWSRRAFAGASASLMAVLAAGTFASWDRLLGGLMRPPSPRSAALLVRSESGPRGERALSEARRLMDEGDPAAALATLSRVGPQEPAYPFARQLRSQAERALHGEAANARAGGHRP